MADTAAPCEASSAGVALAGKGVTVRPMKPQMGAAGVSAGEARMAPSIVKLTAKLGKARTAWLPLSMPAVIDKAALRAAPPLCVRRIASGRYAASAPYLASSHS